jgi:hypothetical protein
MTKRNLIRSSALAVFLALWSAVAPPPATADQSVYVTGSGNEFGALDLTTGAFTSIATLALPGGDAIFGMGFANGILYGVDSQPNANLWQINTNTGGLTDLGAIGQSAIGATSDAGGKLFVLSQDVNAIYYTMNPPSTSPNVVATTTINTAGGLVAVTADGSQLFATVLNTSGLLAYDLLSINPTTGAVSTVGNLGGTFTPDAGLFVGGTLYGFDTTSDAIVTINTSTGLGTQVATYSLPNGDAVFAAAYMVPEPSGLVLSLIATVVAGSFGVIRHRRRT